MEKQKNVFRRSLDELKSPRALVITAMLIALNLAMDLMGLKIYLTPELRVSALCATPRLPCSTALRSA